MKYAKIVAVGTAAPETLPAAIASARIAALLRRYPDTSPEETEQICDYLTRGPLAEVGNLGAEHGVAPELARFRRDHARRLGPGLIRPLAMIAVTLGPALALAWAYLR